MPRLTAVLSLTLLLVAAAAPVRQLNDGIEDGITAALASPLPSPSPSTSPPTQPSTQPSLSPSPPTAGDALQSPTPSPGLDTIPFAAPATTPSPSPSPIPPAGTGDQPVAETPTPTPIADELLGQAFDDDDGLTGGDQPADDTQQESADDADFKSADTGLAASPGSISAIALVGIALAILAPAVIIYWALRRRAQPGFENMPEAEENTYRGPGRDSFTVA